MAEHTFITSDELITFLFAYGWIFPASVIVTFLTLYRYNLIRKIKDLIKRNKNLTDLTGRSNGHHKPKEKVHE